MAENIEFKYWWPKQEPEVQRIQAICETPTTDEPARLIQDLIEVEAQYARLQKLLCDAEEFLDIAECRAVKMVAKKHGYGRGTATEFERKVEVAAEVTEERHARDWVEGLLETAKQRINFGQTLLNFIKTTFGDAPRSVQGRG